MPSRNPARVEKLWMTRAKAVENLPSQIFFPKDASTHRQPAPCARAFVLRFA
jgi:hypothetical protein